MITQFRMPPALLLLLNDWNTLTARTLMPPVSVFTEILNDPRDGCIISKCQMRISEFCIYHTFPDKEDPPVMASQTNLYSLQALTPVCHLNSEELAGVQAYCPSV